METLPKDVAIEMALNLSPADLIRFCSASKAQNRICNSRDFWRRKLKKDYPEVLKAEGEIIENPKEIYIQKFTYISRSLERLQEKIIAKSFPHKFSKYLTDEYRKDLYFSLYLIYEMIKNEDEEYEDDEYTYVVEQLDDLIPEQILRADYESLATKILRSMHKIVSNE